MITGFNTDVKYRGVVYHVQTEDKGTANPLIETLIYKGGEILGSRRLPYADLVDGARRRAGHHQADGRPAQGHDHRGEARPLRPRRRPRPCSRTCSLDEIVLAYLAARAGAK